MKVVDHSKIKQWAKVQRATLIGRPYMVQDESDLERFADWIEKIIRESGCVTDT